RAGRHVGRVLAEAMAGDKRRREAALLEQAPGGGTDGQNRRLRVLGQRQLILRAFEDDPAERFPERRVRLFERPAANRKRIGQRLAHADFLRTLSWKKKRDHAGEAAAISCPTRWMICVAANR